MGTVYRKSFTNRCPPNAEIITRKGERLARWRDEKGKTRTAPLTGGRGPHPDRIGARGTPSIATATAASSKCRPDAATRPPPAKCSPTWSGRPSECGPV